MNEQRAAADRLTQSRSGSKISARVELRSLACRAAAVGLGRLLDVAVAAVSNEALLVFHSLDKLLDSGLYTGEITELSGGPGSGKSQVNISASPPSACLMLNIV